MARRRHQRYLTVAVLVLGMQSPAWAGGIAVFDAALNTLGLNQIMNQIKEYGAMLQQLQNEANMIQNQIQQIRHAATTVQHGVTNLTRLDFSNIRSLQGLIDTLNGKLAAADMIGYSLEHAWQQAESVYGKVSAPLDAAQQRQLWLRWTQAQRSNAQVAIQAQAIQEQQRDLHDRWEAVLAKARSAEGNLQIGQANAAALGIVGAQLQGIELQMATANRLQAQREMRDAAQIEMTQEALVIGGREFDTIYEAQGQIVRLPR
jgi:P-type conjugative transfer protein TrbJ